MTSLLPEPSAKTITLFLKGYQPELGPELRAIVDRPRRAEPVRGKRQDRDRPVEAKVELARRESWGQQVSTGRR